MAHKKKFSIKKRQIFISESSLFLKPIFKFVFPEPYYEYGFTTLLKTFRSILDPDPLL